MKHLLLTTIAAVLVVGCGPPKAPDISIHDAAFEGNIGAVKQHIAAGADVNAKTEDGWTPLHGAAVSGKNEIVELLIAEGADINAKNRGGVTPLYDAAFKGHKEIAELLIAAGADVNAKGKIGTTPLQAAAMFSHKEIVELLIDAGADVNVKDHEFGETPLDWVDDEIADLLRKHGGKTGEELKAAGN